MIWDAIALIMTSLFNVTIKHFLSVLTHWGRVTHICVTELTIIGSDNGLSPGRRQAIIWTNAGILLTGALGTNVSEILIKIYTFSLKKMHLKMSSGKMRPSCLGINVLSVIPCWIQLLPINWSKTFSFDPLHRLNSPPPQPTHTLYNRDNCNLQTV